MELIDTTIAKTPPFAIMPTDTQRLYYNPPADWYRRGALYATVSRFTLSALEQGIAAMMQRAGTYDVHLHLVISPILALAVEDIWSQHNMLNQHIARVWLDTLAPLVGVNVNIPWFLFESAEFLTADLERLKELVFYGSGIAPE